MRTLNEISILKRFDITGEEELIALGTFSAEQLALFHNMLTETVLLKAALVYDPTEPLSQCTASFEYDGKIKLLKLLLSQQDSVVDLPVSNSSSPTQQE